MKSVPAITKLLIKEIFRKKDFYVAFILIGVILAYAARMNFYHVENVSRYLMEIGLFLVFFTSVILTVSLAARQYPAEIQNRTCAVLMAKPLSRLEFVLGKFTGSFLAGGSVFVIFYGLFLLITLQKADHFSAAMIAQTGFLFLLSLLVMTAMASGLSYYLTTSANVTICLVLYLLMNTYGASLKQACQNLFIVSKLLGIVFYYLLPHLEFFDLRQRFIHDWPALPSGLLLFLSGYALVYALIFLLIGWARFKKASL